MITQQQQCEMKEVTSAMEIADHYGITVAEKNCKKIKTALLLSLFEQGVLLKVELCAAKVESLSMPVCGPVVVQTVGLTFEQQKQLLALWFDQEKLRRLLEREQKLELDKLRQAEKLELERMRQNTEKMKLELENSKLQLIREGKLSLRKVCQ